MTTPSLQTDKLNERYESFKLYVFTESPQEAWYFRTCQVFSLAMIAYHLRCCANNFFEGIRTKKIALLVSSVYHVAMALSIMALLLKFTHERNTTQISTNDRTILNLFLGPFGLEFKKD